MLLAGVANLVQRAASSNLLQQDATAERSRRTEGAPPAANKSASPNAAAERLAQIFPTLYWYASDACLRETTRHGFGHPQKRDEFVKSNKAVIEKFDEIESRGIKPCNIRLRLHDPESPDSVLKQRNSHWNKRPR